MSEIHLLKSRATIEFHCGRCDTDKVSRDIGTWHKEDGTVAICYDCYGELRAEAHGQT